MQVDLGILITIVFGIFSMIVYIGTLIAKAVTCLTVLKTEVHSIKETQKLIFNDITKLENKVFV